MGADAPEVNGLPSVPPLRKTRIYDRMEQRGDNLDIFNTYGLST